MQLPPGASVVPAQFWNASKFVGSSGAPPENAGVVGTADTFVIVTASDTEAPTRTVPKERLVGATANAPPVPDIVIGKFSLSIPMVVLLDLAPSVAGWNV
jgi:hypothetical protein